MSPEWLFGIVRCIRPSERIDCRSITKRVYFDCFLYIRGKTNSVVFYGVALTKTAIVVFSENENNRKARRDGTPGPVSNNIIVINKLNRVLKHDTGRIPVDTTTVICTLRTVSIKRLEFTMNTRRITIKRYVFFSSLTAQRSLIPSCKKFQSFSPFPVQCPSNVPFYRPNILLSTAPSLHVTFATYPVVISYVGFPL